MANHTCRRLEHAPVRPCRFCAEQRQTEIENGGWQHEGSRENGGSGSTPRGRTQRGHDARGQCRERCERNGVLRRIERSKKPESGHRATRGSTSRSPPHPDRKTDDGCDQEIGQGEHFRLNGHIPHRRKESEGCRRHHPADAAHTQKEHRFCDEEARPGMRGEAEKRDRESRLPAGNMHQRPVEPCLQRESGRMEHATANRHGHDLGAVSALRRPGQRGGEKHQDAGGDPKRSRTRRAATDGCRKRRPCVPSGPVRASHRG